MICRDCHNGNMYDVGLYPIVKCSNCGNVRIDYKEQFLKDVALINCSFAMGWLS